EAVAVAPEGVVPGQTEQYPTLVARRVVGCEREREAEVVEQVHQGRLPRAGDALPLQLAEHARQRQCVVERVVRAPGVDAETGGEVDQLGAAARQRAGQRQRVEEDERSEEHTSELQSRFDLVCRLLLE